jgi:CheY-like chemotaxis protein
VLLVDDNEDFLDVVSEWLTDNPDLGIIGTAHSGRQAIEEAERLAPDLVLMDVTMSEMNGFEAARRIKSKPDAPLVVLMTLHASKAARHEAWAAGADELIPKVDLTRRLTAFVRDLRSKPLSANGAKSAATVGPSPEPDNERKKATNKVQLDSRKEEPPRNLG